MPIEMIEAQFQALRFSKAAKEKREITLREIAAETHLSLGNVHKLSSGNIRGVRIETWMPFAIISQSGAWLI